MRGDGEATASADVVLPTVPRATHDLALACPPHSVRSVGGHRGSGHGTLAQRGASVDTVVQERVITPVYVEHADPELPERDDRHAPRWQFVDRPNHPLVLVDRSHSFGRHGGAIILFAPTSAKT